MTRANLTKRNVYTKRKRDRSLSPKNSSLDVNELVKLILELRSNRARDAWAIRKLKAIARAKDYTI